MAQLFDQTYGENVAEWSFIRYIAKQQLQHHPDIPRHLDHATCHMPQVPNYESKLSMFYERDLGITSAYPMDSQSRAQGPHHSVDGIYARKEQKKVGVSVEKVPAPYTL